MEDLSIRDLIKEIKILDIKPNQALCITLDHMESADMLHRMTSILREELGCKVIFFGPDTELTVVNVEDEDSRD